MTLTQRITLNIRLRFALNLPFTVSHPKGDKSFFVKQLDENPLVLNKGIVRLFGDIIPFNFKSEKEAFAAHEKCQNDHARLLSYDESPIPFLQFFKLVKEAQVKTQIGENDELEAEESGTEKRIIPFGEMLRELFNATFYIVDEENKERSFIHYFLGVPQKKPLTPGWSKFFLGWDILFYVAGMWLIAPLKNIVKLSIEFLPLAAACMFGSFPEWMLKKDLNFGLFVCAVLGSVLGVVLSAISGALWFVGRALASPLTSLKEAVEKTKDLRKTSPVLGWVATVFLVGLSAAISLAGIASIAAVSSVFFPAVAGTVIGEGLAATVPTIAPPIVAAAAGAILAGDEAMKSTADGCGGSTRRMRLLGTGATTGSHESDHNHDHQESKHGSNSGSVLKATDPDSSSTRTRFPGPGQKDRES